MTRTLILGAFCALLAAVPALAQTEGGKPPAKTIGTPAAGQVEPSLIVLNAKGASLTGGTLKLAGVGTNAIVFADRPVRAAGHALVAHVLEDWADGESFAKDPPNATVSAMSKDGETIADAVVVLKNPKLLGGDLTFDVQVLEGALDGADGPAAVFIDIIGMPFTPLSYAGVARRTARRTAWYAGAAGAAAAATYPYYHPYYPPPPPPPYGYPYYRPYY